MNILKGTEFLFSLTHPEESSAMQALKDYLENMYFG